MTAFTLGMIAAGLWLILIILIWVLGRTSPKHPFMSIGNFRRTNRKLSQASIESQLQEPNGDEDESDNSLLGFLNEDQPQRASPWLELPESSAPLRASWPEPEFTDGLSESEPFEDEEVEDEEEAEITSVIESITARRAPKKKKVLAAPKSPAAKRGPRKSGKMTYIVVDDQGRPEL